MPSSELLKLTISEIAPMVQSREVSPVDLTEAALAEAELRQPVLNSFITILRGQAMAEAERQEAALARVSTWARCTESPSESRTTSPPPESPRPSEVRS